MQQSRTDTTAGRLARADYAYGPGNLLDAVSESGGTPTGGVIERGTAGGDSYIRLADGTQICTTELTLTQVASGRIEASWTYPVGFASDADIVITPVLDAASFVGGVTGPGLDEALAPCVLDITDSAVTVRIYRIAGGTNFASGDTARCRVMALGRWV